MCKGTSRSSSEASERPRLAETSSTKAIDSIDMNDSEYSTNTAWSYIATSRRSANSSHRNGSEIGTSMNENL